MSDVQRQRAAAKSATWQRVSPPDHKCGLCDGIGKALVKMQRFDKQGSLMACSACLRELMGHSETVV